MATSGPTAQLQTQDLARSEAAALQTEDEQLLDPARPKMLACAGELLTKQQVARLFPSGSGDWSMVDEPRSERYSTRSSAPFHRDCNPVTGCSPWYIISGGGSQEYYFTLAFDAENSLVLQQTNWQGTQVSTTTLTATRQVVSLEVGWGAERRFLMEIKTGGICFESLPKSHETPNGTAEDVYLFSFIYDFASVPAREVVATPPSLALAATCNEQPASVLEVGAWFKPGATYLALGSKTQYAVAYERDCHPLTGCTQFKGGEDVFFNTLHVVDGGLTLDAKNVQNDYTTTYTLNGTMFAIEDATIAFGKTCGRADWWTFRNGGRANQTQRIGSATIFK